MAKTNRKLITPRIWGFPILLIMALVLFGWAFSNTPAIAIGNILGLFLLLATYTLMVGESTHRMKIESKLARTAHSLEIGKMQATTERAKDEALLKSIGEGLIVINEEGDVENINDAALSMLGVSEQDIIGKAYIKVIQAYDDDGQPVKPLDRPVLQAISTGMAVEAYTNIKKGNGSVFPVFLTVAPVLFGGSPIGAVEVFRDVTKERELEQAKEEFVSLASHQLRTPATGVKAFLSMLRDGYAGALAPKQCEFLNKAWESNERQLRIVDDMLHVARADSGRMRLALERTNISAMLDDIIAEQYATITERQQKIKYKKPKLAIKASVDPAKLRMVVENLISNASKYTPAAGIISVTAEATKTHFTISVADTGVGISLEDTKTKLFKRFSRIENLLSDEVGGTGLGLYLAKKIIDLHGGIIKTQSEIGKGTCFSVKIPLKITKVG